MNKALFKFYMIQKGDSAETLAEALNMHVITLYDKIKGAAPFKSPEMAAIVKRWNLTGDEIKDIFFNAKSA